VHARRVLRVQPAVPRHDMRVPVEVVGVVHVAIVPAVR
jgi:hypothetical protein